MGTISQLKTSRTVDPFVVADPARLDDLSPPDILSGEKARQAWEFLVKDLSACGLATVVDRVMLVRLAEDMAECAQAQKIISDMLAAGKMPIVKGEAGAKSNGKKVTGGWNYHPAFVLRNRAAERLANNAEKFGMTPFSRTKIRVQAQEDMFADSDNSIKALVQRIHDAA